MLYRRIVVGTDGSERASRGVRAAAELAARVGARLFVVTAYRHDARSEREAQAVAPEELQWVLTDRAQAEQIAAEGARLAREAGAGEVQVLSGEGPVEEILLRAVEEHGADLVVVGSEGMTGASRLLLGAVANTLSHRATSDVLIVHTTG